MGVRLLRGSLRRECFPLCYSGENNCVLVPVVYPINQRSSKTCTRVFQCPFWRWSRRWVNVEAVVAFWIFIIVSLPSSLSAARCPSFSLSSLLPLFYILEFRGSLPALLARPISSGFCTFQSVPFFPSEADALNKMTTVICLCHSGPSTDYIVAQKYSARRGGRMCVSTGSNSLFFYFPESCLFH